MDNSNKRVSMILLSYKNYDAIWNTIDSILGQEHEDIEIIVTDDASKDFSVKEVESYINSNKKSNIKNVIVMKNEVNQGTVKNLRKALSKMTGAYYMNIGSGDEYSHNKVIKHFMETFTNNSESLLVCANAAMYSEDLKTFLYPMMTEEDKKIVITQNKLKIFNALTYRCILLTVASCYKKEFINAVEAYDESYVFAEDYPTFIRMARKGIVPAFLDEIVTNHAIGGIANGSKNYNASFVNRYYKDKCLMWEKEVRPFWSRIDDVSREKHIERVNREHNNYRTQKYFLSNNPLKVIYGYIRYPEHLFEGIKEIKIFNLIKLILILVIASVFFETIEKPLLTVFTNIISSVIIIFGMDIVVTRFINNLKV